MAREISDKDAADSVFDFLSTISDQVQEEFDKLLSSDSDNKRFLGALSKIFALFLDTKVDTNEKIRKIYKIVIEITNKIWSEPGQQ